MFELNSIKGDHRILELVSDNKAEVNSIFNNSFNMLIKDELVTLIDASSGYIPLGVLVDLGQDNDFKNIGLKIGMVANLSPASISIENTLKIGLNNCLWQKTNLDKKNIDLIVLAENLDLVKKVLVERKIDYGLIPLLDYFDLIINDRRDEYIDLDPVCRRAANILKCFFKALNKGRTSQAVDSIIKLVGLGYGTTPSGDDILLGILISFKYLDYFWSNVGASNHMKRLKDVIREKTTRVSQKYLIQAIDGNISERLEDYMNSLLYAKSEKELRKTSLDLISVGASSGREIMLGTVLALGFYLKTRTKSERKIKVII